MSTMLWIIAGYIVLDRLVTIARVGDIVQIERGQVVLYTITGAIIVTVLVLAATHGVTP